MTLPPPWRKLLLTAHILSSVGFLGSVAGFLAIAATALAVSDATIVQGLYSATELLTRLLIVPLAWASLSVGLIQSLTTPWGLFRHYWVGIKFALTVFAVAVLMLQTRAIGYMASVPGDAVDDPALWETRVSLVLHAGGGLAVLTTATVLSVFKPRGLTRYGRARQQRSRPQT